MGLFWQGKFAVRGDKLALVLHHPPQIPHGLFSYRSRAFAVNSKHLRPILALQRVNKKKFGGLGEITCRKVRP
jgi:hypothetical protein